MIESMWGFQMKILLRFCMVVALSATGVSSAAAQDSTAPAAAEMLAPTKEVLVPGQDTPVPSEEQYILPENIPDILMAEVMDIKNNCDASGLYATYHDCNCIAVKFLDERLKSDPDTPKERVKKIVENRCPNTPAIAGFMYTSCVSFRKRDDPEGYVSFCTCAANEVAKRYSEHPDMNLRYIRRLKKEAFVSCGIANNPAYINR